MRVFLTGGTGFIGGYTLPRLISRGHQVVCLVRNPDQAGRLEEMGARLHQGEVNDQPSLAVGMQGCSWVINLANVYNWWLPREDLYFRVNVEGTRKVMEAALASGVQKVVHVSTVVVWGKPSSAPVVESTPMAEHRTTKYAQSKHQGDLIAWQLYRQKGLPLVMVYPAAVLGPGDPKSTGDLIKDLINRRLPALAFRQSMLSVVDVEDAAEIIVRAAEKEANLGQKYIACGHSLPFGRFAEMVCQVAGVPAPALTMPAWLAMFNAGLLTGISRLTKKLPLWGMSQDAMRAMRDGHDFDGSKATRELGVDYKPLSDTLEAAVRSLKGAKPNPA